jgi:hypothetical protein
MNDVDDKVFTEQTNMMSKFRWVQTRTLRPAPAVRRLQFVKLKRNLDHVLIKARPLEPEKLWLNENVGGTVFRNEIGYLNKNCNQANEEWKWGQMSFEIHHKGKITKNGGPTQFYESKSSIPICACIIFSVQKCSSCITWKRKINGHLSR